MTNDKEPNKSRMLVIAAALMKLYKAKARYSIETNEYERFIENRKIELLPKDEEGNSKPWPGSNDKARLVAQTEAYAKDEAMQELLDNLFMKQGIVELTKAQIDGLHAERRALEWDVSKGILSAVENRRPTHPARHAAQQLAGQELIDDADDDVPF